MRQVSAAKASTFNRPAEFVPAPDQAPSGLAAAAIGGQDGITHRQRPKVDA
jgi:hypothetical protein